MRTVWSLLNQLGVPITRAIWNRFLLMMRDLGRSEVGGKARAAVRAPDSVSCSRSTD